MSNENYDKIREIMYETAPIYGFSFYCEAKNLKALLEYTLSRLVDEYQDAADNMREAELGN
jgi:hypothetical protein